MPLTLAQLEQIRGDNFADDVPIDALNLEEMSRWSAEEAAEYFASGGTRRPPSQSVPASGEVEAHAEAGLGRLSVDDTARVSELKAKGNAELKSGNTELAVATYRQALELCNPSHADLPALHSNVAQALLKLDRAEEALASAEECIFASPEWHKSHYRKGDALFALRQYDGAARSYESALRLRPSEAEISRALALAREAAAGGLWLRALLPGRDIALSPASADERLLFGAAHSMKNLVYLVGDLASRECYAVDACWDVRGVAAIAAGHKMRLVGAIATHYHFDHAGGAVPPHFVAMIAGPMHRGDVLLPGLREMGRDYGAKLYCHSAERERLAIQCRLGVDELHALDKGARLPLGDARHIEVLHTPGHSAGSVCLCVRERAPPTAGAAGAAGAADKASAVLAGDTLFPGSCGRLDLPDSDVDAMFDSLQTLRALPDATPVYPGHAYSGERTTIGHEKRAGLLRDFSRQQWAAMHGG